MQQTTIAPSIDLLDDEESTLTDDTLERPPLKARVASLIAVVFPFLGLVAACVLMWDSGTSPLNLGMLVVGYILTALGITVGYHRLFTHKSFTTTRWMTAILGVLGSMATQGSILTWVATHRRHHQHSDHEHDPHSPHNHGSGLIAWCRGFYHAHIGWFFEKGPTQEVLDRYVPDLKSDRLTCVISDLFGLWVLLSLLVPAGIGLAATGTWYGALTGLIWGGLLRMFLVHHVTWSINSVCHIWGGHPYNTRDLSRNNPVFGILAFGEGWHNNHHAFPASARHGLAWWQVDIAYIFIRSLALVGLAWDVKLPSPERMKAKRLARKAVVVRAGTRPPSIPAIPEPVVVVAPKVPAHSAG